MREARTHYSHHTTTFTVLPVVSLGCGVPGRTGAAWLRKNVGAPDTDGDYLRLWCTWRLSDVDPASTRQTLPDVSALSAAQRAQLLQQLQQLS